MDHFYGQNAKLSNIRTPGGTANIHSPRVSSPMMSGKLLHKQFSWNSPTDYSSSYLDILRHLQANTASSAAQNIEEGTLVVDFIRDNMYASSPYIKSSGKTMHQIEEIGGSYRGRQSHQPKFVRPPRRLPPRKISEERRTRARAIALVAATPVALPRSQQVQGKSNKMILDGDWSPLDDGIQVKLGSQFGETPSREGANDYIKKFLRGVSIRPHRRLPVFSQICTP